MKKLIFFVITCITIFSCSKDSELNRTIFIPDEKNPQLPAYTEWGYNSFGAMYELTYFLANQSIIPCKIVYQNDSLRFLMSGVYGNENPRKKMSFIFIFPFEIIEDYKDLMLLDNKKINLRSDCKTLMITENNIRTLEISAGELHFKRVQLLKVDEVDNRAILSGTFEIKFIGYNLFPENFSDGRFDFGITNREFSILTD